MLNVNKPLEVVKVGYHYANFYVKMKYFEIAKELFLEAIKSNRVVVYYDPDVDGIIAGTAMYNYIVDQWGIKPSVAINRNRGHGVIDLQMLLTIETPVENVVNIPTDYYIINVDSGISESQLKTLVDAGYNVLSLDHHELGYDKGSTEDYVIQYTNEETGNRGIIINNQYSFEDPAHKFQSGAGVVMSFIHYMTPGWLDQEMIALNGITLLSDARPIESPEARLFLETLYTTPPSKYPIINHVTQLVGFNDYSHGVPTLDRVYIDFKFSPFVNALMRFDMGYETIKMFNLQEVVADKPHERQKAVVEALMLRMSLTLLDNLVIVTIPKYTVDDFEPSNFIGLVANKMVQKYAKTCVISAYNLNRFYRGSVRGLYNSVDYNTAFNKMGMDARGHPGAFGLKTINSEPDFWLMADKYIGVLDEKHIEQYTIKRMFSLEAGREELQKIAYENMFKRGLFKTYIKYSGYSIDLVPTTSVKLIDYNIDNLRVKSFDVDLKPSDPDVYIEPTLDKGYLKLYLVRLSE